MRVALVASVCLGVASCSGESNDTLSDHPDIARVVEAAEARDVDALVELVEYTQIECVAVQEGIGAPPLCEGDEAPGDTIDVLPAAQCEGYFVRGEDVGHSLTSFVNSAVTFYAAYRGNGFPPGDIAVVFERFPAQGPRPRGGAIYLTGGRVSGIDHGCGGDAARFAERFDTKIIKPVD